MIVFTDDVVTDIYCHIAAKEPEQGGAGMGPADSNLISLFVPDSEAATTQVSYVPSSKLTKEVRRIEGAGELVLKCVLHSHPGNFDSPSGPDRTAFAETLTRNPHMPCLIAPIITRQKADVVDEAQVCLGAETRMTCYRAWRRAGTGNRSGVVVERVSATVSPMTAAAEALLQAVKRELEPEALVQMKGVGGSLMVSGASYLTKVVHWSGFELTLLFPPTFPFTKPTALLTRREQASCQTEEIFFDWSIAGAGLSELEARLLPRLMEALSNKETD